MKWFKITISLMLIVSTGVGAWAVITKLDESMFKVISGIALAVIVFIIVGIIFVGRDIVQAYLMHKVVAQDDLHDLKQMAMIFRLMNGRSPNVNVKVPEQQQPWSYFLPTQGQQPPSFDGTYRDTTDHQDIEIE